jgi:undecaprenyl-diphosphatase
MSFDVILLGVIQGFTEFLPVSSSGHLALANIIFGTGIPPLSYDIVLHVATAFATVLFFIWDIWRALVEWLMGFKDSEYRRSAGWSIGWAVIFGTIMTGIVGMVLKNLAEAASRNSLLVGLGLLFTGAMLLGSRYIRSGLGTVYARDGFLIGIAQGIAVMPGISRSGLTILTGQAIGLEKEEMFRFSFMLSIPAILGATVLQAFDVGGWHAFVSTLPAGWYYGAGVSFLCGFLALAILKRIVIASKWWVFGIYCLIAGFSAVIISCLGMW